MDRRNFLKFVAAGTCGSLIHRTFEPLNGMLAFALPETRATLASDSVLIIVNLAGGCSYNIAGSYIGAYRDKFANISYGPPGSPDRSSLAISSDQGVHPSLTLFKNEFDAGNLALLNMVGLDGTPDFGHDTASEKWQRGVTAQSATTAGWMARMTCQLGTSFSGISLAGIDTITQGDCNSPLALGDLNNFGEDSFWGGTNGTLWLQMKRAGVINSADAPLTAAEKKITASTSNLETTLGTIQSYINAPLPVTFPNTGFGRSCRDAARLILAKPLGTRIIYLSQGGYDTHSDELSSHLELFNTLNAGLNALVQTLKLTGNYERCVIATMSEFGRTFQNSDLGTDHGYASPMFILGGKVNGGIHTPSPRASDLTGNYIRNRHCDPREAYSQIVSAMGLDSGAIFPENFSRAGLQLLRA